MNKIKTAIIGTGNIGTDLLFKIQRSEFLECSLFVGRRADSKGIQIANSLGVETSIQSIDAIVNNPNCCDIVFDATSAQIHLYNASILKKLKKFVIDLTPSLVGKMCVPIINGEECILEDNISMITCGGQATLPIAYAIASVQKNIKYIEIVATISSKSAGIGTRNNIDEFTQTTKDALAKFTGINNTKAIIILNPAEPPINMKNTLYMTVDKPDLEAIKNVVNDMENRVKKYVPGYKVIVGPIYENGRLIVILQVTGSGDYLPEYSGNLDVITCASIEVAECYAKKVLKNFSK